MIIEEIFPKVIGEKDNLQNCMIKELKSRAIDDNSISDLINSVPEELINIPTFFDKRTNLWRYEFGSPYIIGKGYCFGTDMWPPIINLINALLCAYSRLSYEKYDAYFKRLADANKHLDSLAEMIPGCKLNSTIQVDFETPTSDGKTIDWEIKIAKDRIVLLDVKRRTKDFFEQLERMEGTLAPEPNHDPALLFRSFEPKCNVADPDRQLQGLWIVTNIKQNQKELHNAFGVLDPKKTHFAILGDWREDAYVLAIDVKYEQYIRQLFNLKESRRFIF